VFRGAFDQGLTKLGASIRHPGDDHNEVVIVDFGCDTGTRTCRLAKQYPQATHLIGIDLSPYFINVGRTLLKLAPSAIDASDDNSNKNGWITTINSDERIQLRQGDITNTQLPSNSVSVVNLSMVLHELPISAAKQVLLEAYQILRPSGQLWVSEMDFESPAYKAQQENALLFSLLQATEPYLDEYADGMCELRTFMTDIFDVVKITAATGRHYSLMAEKSKDGVPDEDGRRHAVIEDYRFREDGSYAVDDTHLKPWESKVYSSTLDGDRTVP
jgi:ubiquinone/menaquinone biosynthesis C-methylase UbiE